MLRSHAQLMSPEWMTADALRRPTSAAMSALFFSDGSISKYEVASDWVARLMPCTMLEPSASACEPGSSVRNEENEA